ncbi:MAG TPA: VWA domain-containing protein, partial [Candidatus Omnitrophota bacterium]|nr:VWA domain-containing protein [Candidatus Omnitrophota bacterium]
MTFKDPWVLLFIPAFLFLFYLMRRHEAEAGFLFPSSEAIHMFRPTLREFFASKLFILRLLCMVFLIVALARPQMSKEFKTRRDALGIVLAIDCSSTMLAEDLSLGPAGIARLTDKSEQSKRFNRLDAVKEVAKTFVDNRPEDLIGLVAFGAEAFIACPLTFDHEWLTKSIDRMKIGYIKDGTAIGSGILTSLNSLKDANVKSKIVILLSDGINNAGTVPPLVAAKAARAVGVKIYTVGIVSKGQTPYPTVDPTGKKTYKDVRIDINETVLQKMAEITGGQYFRADDMQTLRKTYQDID